MHIPAKAPGGFYFYRFSKKLNKTLSKERRVNLQLARAAKNILPITGWFFFISGKPTGLHIVKPFHKRIFFTARNLYLGAIAHNGIPPILFQESGNMIHIDKMLMVNAYKIVFG